MTDMKNEILTTGVGLDESLDLKSTLVGNLFDRYTLVAKSRAKEPENTNNFEVSCAMEKDGQVIFRTGQKEDEIYSLENTEFLGIMAKKFPEKRIVYTKNDNNGKLIYGCWSLGDYLLRKRQVDPNAMRNNQIKPEFIWTISYKERVKTNG